MGKVSLFASGLLLGGVLAAAGYVAWHVPRSNDAAPGGRASGTAEELASSQPVPAQAVAAAPPSARSVVPRPCGFDPVLEPSGAGDQQFELQAALAADRQPEAHAFLAVAREAAAQGRQRDAEVALIAACRMAARATPPPSVLLSDVLSRLGQHYAEAGASQPSETVKDEAMTRARQLLADSVAGYTAVLGRNASKTRIAQRRMAALEHADAQPRITTVDAETAAQGPAAMGAAREPMAAPIDKAILVGPCGRNHSAACADPELAQLESDLRRLGAQAASVTRDPQGFRRRAAQARPDPGCQDKACLQHWYAQRRRQLLDEF